MPETITTRCCIAGGGPAGMMLGFLLARAGIDVVVLEKHKDFLRDFRGDTIHPSTLELMHELGLLDEFLKLPHERAETLSGRYGSLPVTIADFRHLPTQLQVHRADAAVGLPEFPRRTGPPLSGLPSADAGRGERPDRGGRPRRRACARKRRTADSKSAPPSSSAATAAIPTCARRPASPSRRSARRWTCSGSGCRASPPTAEQTGGVFLPGRIFVMLNRGDYWQCAYVIPKGSHGRGAPPRAGGVPRATSRRRCRTSRDRAGEIADWDHVKLLTVAVDRLNRWHKPGLLCIGDAAHAMSPIGGVGVNLAVQDAVAAANILAEPLRGGAVDDAVLQSVQDRRAFPTRVDPADAALHAEQRHQRRAVGHGRARAALAAAAAWRAFRCCAAFRRGCSASASGPSTSARRSARLGGVIPGRRAAANPESRPRLPACSPGFRVRAFGAPRNDSGENR